MEQKSWSPVYDGKGYVQDEVEWPALAAGFVVGCFWWAFHHTGFVGFYWTFVHLFHRLGCTPHPEFDIVYELVNLGFASTQALTIGLTVGLLSRDKPYLLTSLAIAATFAAKFFIFNMAPKIVGDSDPRPISEIEGGLIGYAVIYLTIPIAGTYLAQKLVQWVQRKKAGAEQNL